MPSTAPGPAKTCTSPCLPPVRRSLLALLYGLTRIEAGVECYLSTGGSRHHVFVLAAPPLSVSMRSPHPTLQGRCLATP